MTTRTKTVTRRQKSLTEECAPSSAYPRHISNEKGNQKDERKRSNSSSSKNKTLSWHQAQPWEQDNHFILSGYRPMTNSYLESCHSLLTIHNQTVNIWSHLIGSILYGIAGLYLWISLASYYHVSFGTGDLVAFGCYFVGVVACLSMSVGYHLFANHSKEVHDRHLFLDFLGILGLIWGSWVPGIYYGFYCDLRNAAFYWGLISSFTTACAITILIPTFRQPRWKHIRTTLFVGLGLAGIMPMFYAASTFGISIAHAQMGWGWFCLEGVFYISGVVAYATKVPEKWFPGRFDIWGASHQVFHVMVLFGAAAHLMGVLTGFWFNHGVETRICDVWDALW